MTTDITLFCLSRTIISQEFRQLDAIPLGFGISHQTQSHHVLP